MPREIAPRWALARSSVQPGASRPTAESHQAERLCVRGLSARRASAQVGSATSKSRPTSRPKNRAGVTPTISNWRPSTESVSPGESSRPPSSRRQKGSLRTTDGEGQPGRVVGRDEEPAAQRRDADGVEERPLDPERVDVSRLAAGGEVDAVGRSRRRASRTPSARRAAAPRSARSAAGGSVGSCRCGPLASRRCARCRAPRGARAAGSAAARRRAAGRSPCSRRCRARARGWRRRRSRGRGAGGARRGASPSRSPEEASGPCSARRACARARGGAATPQRGRERVAVELGEHGPARCLLRGAARDAAPRSGRPCAARSPRRPRPRARDRAGGPARRWRMSLRPVRHARPP